MKVEFDQIWQSNLVEFKFRNQIRPEFEFRIRYFWSNSELFWVEFEIRPSLKLRLELYVNLKYNCTYTIAKYATAIAFYAIF